MAEVSASATEAPAAAPSGTAAGEGEAAAPVVADLAVARAERIAFLALASELARGRKVLVVDDGASALAGVATHLESTTSAALAEREPGSCELLVADLTDAAQLPADGAAALSRIVEPQAGTLLIRLPHRPEFAPLSITIAQSFPRSLSLRQHNWVSSALFDDAMFANDDPARAVAASVRKLAAAPADAQLYDVIVATHGSFPSFRPQLALTRSPELSHVLAELEDERTRAAAQQVEAAAAAERQEARIIELEEELAWYDENHLALRRKVERGGLAALLLSLWVFFAGNIGRVSRALRD